jgi:polyisoprenoid-binding protein YceI
VTTAQETQTSIPTGVWKSDPIHTHIGFSVDHAGATFKGDFDKFDATLDNTGEEPKLTGSVEASSLKVRDEQLQGHLASPDFFDLVRYPEIGFESSSVRVEGDKVVVEGELSIKDAKQSVAAEGSVAKQSTYLDGKEHLGLDLETKIDRNDYGVSWNAELPSGGNAVGDEVTLIVHLEFIKED